MVKKIKNTAKTILEWLTVVGLVLMFATMIFALGKRASWASFVFNVSGIIAIVAIIGWLVFGITYFISFIRKKRKVPIWGVPIISLMLLIIVGCIVGFLIPAYGVAEVVSNVGFWLILANLAIGIVECIKNRRQAGKFPDYFIPIVLNIGYILGFFAFDGDIPKLFFRTGEISLVIWATYGVFKAIRSLASKKAE